MDAVLSFGNFERKKRSRAMAFLKLHDGQTKGLEASTVDRDRRVGFAMLLSGIAD